MYFTVESWVREPLTVITAESSEYEKRHFGRVPSVSEDGVCAAFPSPFPSTVKDTLFTENVSFSDETALNDIFHETILIEEGKTTAMICSGDAGVYGMSGLMLEIGQEYPDVEVECIPGVTAAIGGAAVLGAPLIHDFALISLSDLLTPWEKIEKRLLAAAAADFVICLYNPSSKKRHDYLQKACDLILQYQPETLVCATVSQIGRDGEEKHIYTLKELRDLQVDMFTTVFIGNSQTREINGCMVTPRGYRV